MFKREVPDIFKGAEASRRQRLANMGMEGAEKGGRIAKILHRLPGVDKIVETQRIDSNNPYRTVSRHESGRVTTDKQRNVFHVPYPTEAARYAFSNLPSPGFEKHLDPAPLSPDPENVLSKSTLED